MQLSFLSFDLKLWADLLMMIGEISEAMTPNSVKYHEVPDVKIMQRPPLASGANMLQDIHF